MSNLSFHLIEFDNNTYVDDVISYIIKSRFSIDKTTRITKTSHVLRLLSNVLPRFKPEYLVCTSIVAIDFVRSFFDLIRLSLFCPPSSILNLKYSSLSVGDAILSSFLRSRNSSARYQQNLSINVHFFASLFKLSIYDLFFKILILTDPCSTLIFHSPETTYFPECLRRLALKYKFKELRWRPLESQFRITDDSFYGYDFRLYRDQANRLQYLLNDSLAIRMGQKLLNDITLRRKTYSYMSSSDINTTEMLDCSTLDTKPLAVIYMCVVSDAQFIFGPDCFFDLHDWLITSIRLAHEAGFNVIIKPHPSFFKSSGILPADLKYLNYLCRYLSISSFSSSSSKDVPSSSLINTRLPSVYICSSAISSSTLKESLGNYIGITHHGTVAFELAELSIPCIVSSASYFSLLPENNFTLVCYKLEDFQKHLYQYIKSSKTLRTMNCPDQLYALFYFINTVGRVYFPVRYLSCLFSDSVSEHSLTLKLILDKSISETLSQKESQVLTSFKLFASKCYDEPSLFRTLNIS